jgi:hypothetical protein
MQTYIFSIFWLTLVCIQHLPGQSVLKEFNVNQIAPNSVYLQWTTKAGNTCSDLRIERSFEQGVFEEIYQFNGICGESDREQNYTYTDTIVQGGRYGYRINENNGDYSDTLFLQAFTDGADALVYPNPAVNRIYVRFKERVNVPFDFSIYGLDGALVNNGYGLIPGDAIEINTLDAGIYRLKLCNSAGCVFFLRFLHVLD